MLTEEFRILGLVMIGKFRCRDCRELIRKTERRKRDDVLMTGFDFEEQSPVRAKLTLFALLHSRVTSNCLLTLNSLGVNHSSLEES